MTSLIQSKYENEAIPDELIPEDVSPSVYRVLSNPRPKWRGRLHRIAGPLTLIAGVFLALSAPGGRERIGVAIFTAGTFAMFATSGLVHLRRWKISLLEILFRLDHAAIFLMIASGASSLALIAMDGTPAKVMLWSVWIGAGIGILLRVLPFHPPKGLMNTLFIALGCLPLVVAPSLFRAIDIFPASFIVLEGIFYIGGALMLGAQWPKLKPKVFGYHEVWHSLVVLAVAAHFGAVILILHY